METDWESGRMRRLLGGIVVAVLVPAAMVAIAIPGMPPNPFGADELRREVDRALGVGTVWKHESLEWSGRISCYRFRATPGELAVLAGRLSLEEVEDVGGLRTMPADTSPYWWKPDPKETVWIGEGSMQNQLVLFGGGDGRFGYLRAWTYAD